MTFTDNAKAQIQALCAEIKAQNGKDVIPAILWLHKEWNPDWRESGVTIGFYNEDQRAVIERFLAHTDGLEYVVGMPPEDAHRFVGKTLDYRDGTFRLLDRG